MYSQRRTPSGQIDPTYLVPGLPVFEAIAQAWVDLFSRIFHFLTRLLR